jgi:CubicO group peptidase (beta-lactamase class C family)
LTVTLALPVRTWSLAAGEAPADRPAMVFPGEHWEVATPAEEGLDPDRLEQAMTLLRQDLSKKGNLNNAVLIRRGRIVWQTEAAKAGKVEHIWSATKSVASTVLGAMCDRNLCTLDTRIAEYLPQFAQDYGTVTLRHCFSMTSAIRFDDQGRLAASGYGEPGTVYGYDDHNISVGGQALEKIGKKKLIDLFHEYLGNAIGMHIQSWGSPGAAYGLHTTAHDLARLGHLFLNRGRWRDQQVLSASWVEQATSVQVPREIPHVYGKHPKTPNTESGRYGFAWWLNTVRADDRRSYPDAPEHLYAAHGFDGNRLFVIPDWEIVFVVLSARFSREDGPPIFNAFFQRLGQARLEQPVQPQPTSKE